MSRKYFQDHVKLIFAELLDEISEVNEEAIHFWLANKN